MLGKNPLKRRTVLKMFAVAGAAGLLGWPVLNRSSAGHGSAMVERSRLLMGTVVNLTVFGPDRPAAEAAVDATLARMARLEERLSRFRPESEVGRLNRFGRLEEAGDDLLAVLRLGQEVAAASNGAFDPTMLPLLETYRSLGAAPGAASPAQTAHDFPAAVTESGAVAATATPDPFSTPAASRAIARARQLVDYRRLQIAGRQVSLTATDRNPRLDASLPPTTGDSAKSPTANDTPTAGITLDGIGKGYIVDEGAATLVAHGFDQVYVEAGGDLLVKGGKPGARPWRIGLASPRREMARSLPLISATSLAVATSGDYHQPFSADYRHHHIIDPRSGLSAPELAACTVTAPSAALADALATACMVLGREQGSELLGRFAGCQGCFVGKDLTISKTAGFPA